MKRVLRIEKFRNIGLEGKETLVLNHSLKKGKMGNLVILIGENNAGKSNVLDALMKLATKEISKNDVTELNYENEYQNPRLSLVAYEDDAETFKFEFDGKGKISVGYPKVKQPSKSVQIKQDLELIEATEHQCTRYGYSSWGGILSDLKEKLSSRPTAEMADKVHEELSGVIRDIFINTRYHLKNDLRNACGRNPIIESLVENGGDEYEVKRMTELFQAMYGMSFFPHIYQYEEKRITVGNLNVSYNRLENSEFFVKLLNAINVKSDEIVAAYKSFSDSENKGVLKNLETKLNKKLKLVAKKFNDLYHPSESYSFEFDFDAERLFFTMWKGSQTLNLDRQSTGFKWFFNLYFNLLCNSKLSSGDIIIMDEPATNLHVDGQRELRKALKEFAVNNDITIVLATHSPFLLDMDYLDELRFISLDGAVAKISNDFTTVDSDDLDTLNPIKKALTVNNYILYDPDTKVIFVEGITDYNYMVAFKNKLKRSDIIFLPVNGVGRKKDEQIEISKKLIQIKKEPILMVDGDHAGKGIKNVNKADSALTVFTLAEIDEKFITIESLFDAKDAKELGIVNKEGKFEKHSSLSATFKTFDINTFEFSKQTIDNFQKVFDYIDTI
ncbi:MAG: ATP-binding protein [Clostridia bacterium]|nr:ATP-binding protein [Clostridia bacterium]